MKITIYGYVRPSLEKKIIAACKFYAETLLSKPIQSKLILDIEIESNLEDDNQGECFPEDENRNPRYFTIRLKKRSDNAMIKALAHEMVHIKQFAKNELSYKFKEVRNSLPKKMNVAFDTIWGNEIWKPKKNEHLYWDAPWEIEAYGKEPGLFYKFLEQYKRN